MKNNPRVTRTFTVDERFVLAGYTIWSKKQLLVALSVLELDSDRIFAELNENPFGISIQVEGILLTLLPLASGIAVKNEKESRS